MAVLNRQPSVAGIPHSPLTIQSRLPPTKPAHCELPFRGFVPDSAKGRPFHPSVRWLRFFKGSQFSANRRSRTVEGSRRRAKSRSSGLNPSTFDFQLIFRPQTVASFLISPRAGPLLSINSVASFFKISQLSAISHQPSAYARAYRFLPLARSLLPTADPLLAQRWLRSSFRRGPALCYQSTRWLRFSESLSFQPSAVSVGARLPVPASCP